MIVRWVVPRVLTVLGWPVRLAFLRLVLAHTSALRQKIRTFQRGGLC